MDLTVEAIFQRMPEMFRADRAEGVKASIAYNVTGEGGGEFTCVIAEGQLTLLRELKADATATVTISAENWIALNEGRLDPTFAFMSGKLKAVGDKSLLMKFPKMFKRPT